MADKEPMIQCPECHGYGMEDLTEVEGCLVWERCKVCNGDGFVEDTNLRERAND